MEIDYDKVFSKVTMYWFYRNPVLFSTYCRCSMKPNKNISVPFRTGKRLIEYNPALLEQKTLTVIRSLLEMELYRIMLRHPYRKKPEHANENLWYEASNLAISISYAMSQGREILQSIEYYYSLLEKESQEEGEEDGGKGLIVGNNSSQDNDGGEQGQNNGKNGYAKDSTDSEMDGMESHEEDESEEQAEDGEEKNEEELKGKPFLTFVETTSEKDYRDMMPLSNHEEFKRDKKDNQIHENEESKANGEKNTDEEKEDDKVGPTGLWNEDPVEDQKEMEQMIQARKSNQWGKLPGYMRVVMEMNTFSKMPEFKKMLRYFKARSGLGDRVLTRMRPSRRFGFEQMGSRHKNLPSRILVGVDVSLSVSDNAIKEFYGAVRDVFKRGIKFIDVFQFDTELKTHKPVKFKDRDIEVIGRGGTNFQPIIDYATEHSSLYDGLIIFTDGYAKEPVIASDFRVRLFWVTIEKKGIQWWMKNTGLVASMYDELLSEEMITAMSVYGTGGE